MILWTFSQFCCPFVFQRCIIVRLSFSAYACSSFCLFIILSVRLYVCPSICLSVFLSVRLSVCPSICLSVYSPVTLSIFPSFSLYIYVCLSITPPLISYTSINYLRWTACPCLMVKLFKNEWTNCWHFYILVILSE